jgi:hypothetical protein
MTTHVLVESNQSAIMLAKLLSVEQNAGLIEIRATEPLSSLYSAARTLLAVRGEPVALLLDADSTVPEAVARRQLGAEEVVGEAGSSAPVRVLVAVPALDAMLFTRRGPVARVFGAAFSDESALELGRLNPREALKRLDPGGHWWTASLRLVDALDDEDIAELRSMSPIHELIDFVRDIHCTEVAANVGK